MHFLSVIVHFSALFGHTFALARASIQPLNYTGSACLSGSLNTYTSTDGTQLFHAIDRIPVAIGPGTPIESSQLNCTVHLKVAFVVLRNRLYVNANPGRLDAYLSIQSGTMVTFTETSEWVALGKKATNQIRIRGPLRRRSSQTPGPGAADINILSSPRGGLLKITYRAQAQTMSTEPAAAFPTDPQPGELEWDIVTSLQVA